MFCLLFSPRHSLIHTDCRRLTHVDSEMNRQSQRSKTEHETEKNTHNQRCTTVGKLWRWNDGVWFVWFFTPPPPPPLPARTGTSPYTGCFFTFPAAHACTDGDGHWWRHLFRLYGKQGRGHKTIARILSPIRPPFTRRAKTRTRFCIRFWCDR